MLPPTIARGASSAFLEVPSIQVHPNDLRPAMRWLSLGAPTQGEWVQRRSWSNIGSYTYLLSAVRGGATSAAVSIDYRIEDPSVGTGTPGNVNTFPGAAIGYPRTNLNFTPSSGTLSWGAKDFKTKTFKLTVLTTISWNSTRTCSWN